MIVHSSHKQASSEFVSQCMIDYLRYSYSHSTPKDIIHHMRMNYGVSVSYYKAWRAKESVMKLLKGDADDSYALIPKFFSKLKEINPGLFFYHLIYYIVQFISFYTIAIFHSLFYLYS